LYKSNTTGFNLSSTNVITALDAFSTSTLHSPPPTVWRCACTILREPAHLVGGLAAHRYHPLSDIICIVNISELILSTITAVGWASILLNNCSRLLPCRLHLPHVDLLRVFGCTWVYHVLSALPELGGHSKPAVESLVWDGGPAADPGRT
jgi:hypothetical protein